MNISNIGAYSSRAISGVRFHSVSKHLVETKSEETVLDKKTIYDHFSQEDATKYDLNESIIAGFKAAIDKASGNHKKDLEMRLYWHEYNNIFSGGSLEGWRNLDIDSMYSQAAEIFRQIEDGPDSEETKDLKRQALGNALKTGTGMYSMYRVAEKCRTTPGNLKPGAEPLTDHTAPKLNSIN